MLLQIQVDLEMEAVVVYEEVRDEIMLEESKSLILATDSLLGSESPAAKVEAEG